MPTHLRLLATSLLVTVACASTPPPRSLVGPEQIGSRMMHFYEAPDPDFVGTLIRSISEQRILDKPGAAPPMIGFLAAAAQEYPSQVDEWALVISVLPPADQEHFWSAIWLANIPEGRDALLRAKNEGLIAADTGWLQQEPFPLQTLEVRSASDLDMLWGAFFASGDTVYVGRILAVLDWDLAQLEQRYERDQQEGLMELAVWAAAQWALKSNSRQHEVVLQYCRDELRRAEEPRASLLRKVVTEAEAGK